VNGPAAGALAAALAAGQAAPPPAPTPAPAVLEVTAATRLSLADAEAMARSNNPRMAMAQWNALASREVTREATSAYFPNLVANLTAVEANPGTRLTAGGLNNPTLYDRAAGGVSVSQLVTDFGRTPNLVASSRLREQAEGERVRLTEQEIVLAVDRAFYQALEAQTLVRVAEETVAARGAFAERVRALAKSKLKSDLDLSFAEFSLAEANLLLLYAQNAEKAAHANLSAVIGFPDDRPYDLAEEQGAIPPPRADVDALIADALSRRPDVGAEEFGLQAAEKLQLAESDLSLPSVRAAGVFGAAPWRNDHVSANYGAVGINVEIPLFNGFLFQARSKEAELRARAARERVAELRDTVARDVRTSWLDAETAYSRLAVNSQLLDQANLALDLAKTRYELGLGSIVELTQAQLQQTRAEIGEADGRYRYRLAEAALRYQLGGR